MQSNKQGRSWNIHNEITTLLPVQRRLPNCPDADLGSDTHGRNSGTRLLKGSWIRCYTYIDDWLLPSQIWVMQFLFQFQSGIHKGRLLNCYREWQTDMVQCKGQYNVFLLQVSLAGVWIASIIGRCMKAEHLVDIFTLEGLLTEQSMSLARSGASEHSSLLLEPQRFHGDSAGIWNNAAETRRLSLGLGQI